MVKSQINSKCPRCDDKNTTGKERCITCLKIHAIHSKLARESSKFSILEKSLKTQVEELKNKITILQNHATSQDDLISSIISSISEIQRYNFSKDYPTSVFSQNY
jgi:hypothetical protein